jgi:hypothetical protein
MDGYVDKEWLTYYKENFDWPLSTRELSEYDVLGNPLEVLGDVDGVANADGKPAWMICINE